MVAPDLLQNPLVKNWLGGIEPAWTLLAPESLDALGREPSSHNRALSLANDLTTAEAESSSVARNALILLRRACDEGGLKLTATGNLARSVVSEMIDAFEWPDFDRAEAFQLHEVINEPDFMPLFFVRHIAEFTKLAAGSRQRAWDRRCSPKIGSEPSRRSSFMSRFGMLTSYLGRGLHGTWPQGDIGIVLWSLSVAASAWETPERLSRLCAIPINGVVDATWDSGSLAIEARVLRPLLWFGLLEYRAERARGVPYSEQHFYRKAPLFDRFLTFDIRTSEPAALRH